MAAGFYHTLILSVDCSRSRANGWDENIILPFVPLKGTAIGSSGVSSLSSHNLLEDAVQAHPDRGVTFNPGPLTAKELSILSVNNLMKDVTSFAGANQGNQPLPLKGNKGGSKSSLEIKSKVSTRELLAFLTTHLETLIVYDIQVSEQQQYENGTEDGRFTSEKLLNLGTILSCIISMLEISRRTIEDCPQSNSKLPISQDDAMTFFQKLIRITTCLLKKHKSMIVECITLLSGVQDDDDDDVFDVASLQDLSLGTLIHLQESFSAEHKSVSVLMAKNIGMPRLQSHAEIEQHSKSFYAVVSRLRSTLISSYLSMRVDEDRRSKNMELQTDTATLIAKCGRIFFPTPGVLGTYLEALQRNVLTTAKGGGASAIKSFAPDLLRTYNTLNIRLLMLACSLFKSHDEVVSIFQRSRLHGLVIFRSMLVLYSHYSKQTLEKKIQQQNGISTAPVTPVLPGLGMGTNLIPLLTQDIRRLMSLLEHCITNFVKCAVPVIYASALPIARRSSTSPTESPASTLSLTTGKKGSNEDVQQLYDYGVAVIKEIFADAEAVMDLLLLPQQTLSEEIMNQLRYGTVIPSILPSVLIYGVAFTKFGCIMTDVVPCVRSLIRKLQLVGKCDVPTASAITAGTATIGNTPLKSMGANDKNKLAGSIGGGSSEEGLTETAHDEAQSSNGTKKDGQQVTWWFRLLKLSVNFAASTATRMISFPAKQSLTLQSAMGVTGRDKDKPEVDSIEDLSLNGSTHHPVWRYVSLHTPSAQLDVEALQACLVEDAQESTASDAVVALCGKFREREKRSDPMYKMLAQSTQALFSSNLFHNIELSMIEVQ